MRTFKQGTVDANANRKTLYRVRARRGAPIAVLAAAASMAAGCFSESVTSTGPGGVFGQVGSSSGTIEEFADAGGPNPGFPNTGGPNLLQPTFGPTVKAASAPPPISGGTLIVAADGTHAIASDPDRDAIYVVDLGGQKVTHTIALKAGDEPGRLVEDGAGRVHVALRGGGALATVDPTSGSIVARRSVCPAPRGVAWDASTDLVWVACATGELVALPSAGGSSTQSLVLERDLRDVVVSNGSVSVTKFRSAEVLRVASDGSISRRDQLPSPVSTFLPHVAWRVVGAPSGAVVAVHQAETTQSLSTKVQGGYGSGLGGCGGGGVFPGGFGGGGSSGGPIGFNDGGLVGFPVGSGPVSGLPPVPPLDDASASVDAGGGNCFAGDHGVGAQGGFTGPSGGMVVAPPPPPGFGCGPESGAVLDVLTVIAADGTVTVNAPFSGVLPVDVAVSPDGSLIGAVAPGNAFSASLSTLFEFTSCGTAVSLPQAMSGEQPIALAFNTGNDLIVQTRQPSQLVVLSAAGGTSTISLSTVTRADTGYDVFHTQAGGMIACASCHPEGRDDGHVWQLDGNRRRTPSLRGTIAGTAPYHWPGDMPNLPTLTNDVYTVRMSGATLADDQMGALTSWVESIPAPPAPTWVDSSAAQRGKILFNTASVGCATCHSGAKFTNNQTMDVGTGGLFQVPPLVGVGWRTPLLHDGCAATIGDRFGSCSTPQHGSTGSLSTGQVSDLSAYLETL